MLKKIILAIALVATASFATWDKFPVLETHKGQVKVGEYFGMPNHEHMIDEIYAGARFTVIQNLELATLLNFRVLTIHETDDNSVEDDGITGIDNIPLMIRYQFMPILNAFLDITFPTGTKKLCGTDRHFEFHFGAQFSEKFGIMTLGTELGLKMDTKGKDKKTGPWRLNIGAEGDISATDMLTPYLGLDLFVLLGEDQMDNDRTGDLGVEPYVGLLITFNKILALDISTRITMGEDYYRTDDVGMYFDVHLNINF
ncbi:MAG: transporter [Fibrobacter sp.]|nr:transporter [Fibrobacter sp.]